MKVSIRIALLFFALFAIQIEANSEKICPSPLPKKYQHVQPGNKVIGYFANWDQYKRKYTIADVEKIAPELTHLIYAFVKPDAQTGMLQLHDPWADVGAYKESQKLLGGNFKKMIDLKKKYPHLKIIFSVGGGTYASEFAAIAKQGKVRQLAQSCIDFFDSYTYQYTHSTTHAKENIRFEYAGLFDGIDIDWEWVGQADPLTAKAYVEFLQELRKLLRKKNPGLLLTTDLQVSPLVYNSLDLAKIGSIVDWVNVMAYDFYSPNNDSVGLNAPICGTWSVYSIDGALQRLMQLGLSPEKMVLALPLYGYVFENANGFLTKYKKQSDSSKAKPYYSIAQKFVTNPVFQKKWHPQARVPSLYNQKDKIFISYDNERSLAEKVAFASLKRLQGVAFWKLSGDDDQHSLVKHVASIV